jgi:hypothetical protein
MEYLKIHHFLSGNFLDITPYQPYQPPLVGLVDMVGFVGVVGLVVTLVKRENHLLKSNKKHP